MQAREMLYRSLGRCGTKVSVLSLGVSSVITGATRLEQLQENLDALAVRIPDESSQTLDELFPAEESIGGRL
jgi:aryl-alcohol dehydrogenase-like predicted oxidoreductase